MAADSSAMAELRYPLDLLCVSKHHLLVQLKSTCLLACLPAFQTNNPVWKRNRNQYAHLLLMQLQSREPFAPPFTSLPPQGPLPTLQRHLTYRFLPAASPRSRSTSPEARQPRNPQGPGTGQAQGQGQGLEGGGQGAGRARATSAIRGASTAARTAAR